MSEFTTAATARKMTDSMLATKEVDVIVSAVIDKVESRALKGESYLLVSKSNWSPDYLDINTDVVNKLKALGYSVDDHQEDYAPNGDQPEVLYSYKISW